MTRRHARSPDPRDRWQRRLGKAARWATLVLAAVLAAAAAPRREMLHGDEIAPALTASTLAGAQLYRLKAAEWKNPPEASRTGAEPYRLVVDFARNKVEVGTEGKLQDVWLRSYNGGLVGPTFRVKPGDTLKIDLVNRLPKPPAAGHMSMEQCGIHERNDTTNLHTHGLHVSPSGASDDVLREVGPGGPDAPAALYSFAILPAGNPAGWPSVAHHPGTDWYHAHLHGSTAVQLASGMAGALLVEGQLDKIPPIEHARERIFLFQQLAFDNDGQIKAFGDLNANWTGSNPPKTGPKKHTSINGVVKPLIKMHRGQVERWRMIGAGIFEVLDLSLRKQGEPSKTLTFYELAKDGISLPHVREVTQIELGPGYRADALVKAPLEKGTYLLYKARPELNLLAFAADVAPRQQLPDPEILAQVEVDDEPCTSPCSTALVDRATALGAPFRDITKEMVKRPEREKTVTFAVDKVGDKFLFRVNGKCFVPDQVFPEFDLRLHDVEEWVRRNNATGPHPFHIHVNPFQMVNGDGTPGDWRDTIIVPKMENGKPGELRMRTRIDRFTGRFVLHCHILAHEDQGMMQLVEVKKP